MPEQQNISNLIERKQYMQMLRNLKDRNIIKVITGVRRCGKSTLLEMFAGELLQNGVEQAQMNITNKHDFNKIIDFVFDSVGSFVSPRSICIVFAGTKSSNYMAYSRCDFEKIYKLYYPFTQSLPKQKAVEF
ncbi:MAG: AAA family ATPase [Tannerella sp.]|jgi:predicted AAA+ superfamily ATPase|nr:AAA family ATPase [Tannerella sp.]